MRALNLGLVSALSLLAGDALLLTTAKAQTTVATVPVGFTQQTVTKAVDLSTPSSSVISVPFYNTAAYAAAVTTIDSATAFTSASATWTAGAYATAAAPYLVHFKSGTSVGRYFLIASNTTNQITIVPRGYDLSVITAADTFEILPANTLGILFGTTTVPFLTNNDSTLGDNLYLWNGTNFVLYYHDGTKWRKTGSLASQNNTVLYPDDGVFVTRRGTTDLTLTFTGTVPSTIERSDISGPGSTFVSNRFPVDVTLLSIGFQTLPNWISDTDSSVADNVYIWNSTTQNWVLYYYNGTNWKRTGSLSNVNTQVIPTGSSVFVVRKSSAAGTVATLAQNLPYSLN